MLHLTRARVPTAALPSPLTTPAPDPLDPAVLCDISIEGGRITSVARSGGAAPGGALDLGGSLTFPGFVDAHVHLDKTHTWERAPNRTGTFMDALETLHRDSANWTARDLRERAGFALHCAWEHGTRVIRTHVDTWPGGEAGHEVMHELREAWKGRVELQTVPLAGIDALAGPNGPSMAALAVRHGAVALGGWSPMSADLPSQLDRLMGLASGHGVGLDLHVDENNRAGEEVLRLVAEAVLRNRFPHPVVCGHCCSLSVQDEARQRSTLALVRDAGIRIVSLPLCNLYLQDRRTSGFPRTPQWRGVTLLHEFMAQGTLVACASDNVRDAFYAYGDYDAAEVLSESVRIAHLDSMLANAASVVTRGAADLVGATGHGRVEAGARAHLVVFPARSFSEFLSRPGGPRQLVDGESIRDARPPSYAELG
jgi:cytosine/creatinine deaminase